MTPRKVSKFISELVDAAKAPTTFAPGNSLRDHLAKVVFDYIKVTTPKSRNNKGT